MAHFARTIGTVHAGDGHLTVHPRLRARGERPLLVLLPSAGGSVLQYVGGIERHRLVRRLVEDLQVTAVCGDFGGADTLGNDLATGRCRGVIDQARLGPDVSDAPVIGLAVSMGQATALKTELRFPGTFRAVASISGLADLDDIVNNDRAGFAAKARTAYGVAPGAPLPPTANPLTNVAGMAGITAWRGWTAADDPLTLASRGEALETALRGVGVDATHTVLPSGGHADSIVPAVPYDELRDFLAEQVAAA